uniref:hypothetical protein n=1 Tax=Flavobacterium sp. TaxID=239 RepID=UPI0040491946
MNSTLIFLVLISIYLIVWHHNLTKKEQQLHHIVVSNLEKKIALQNIRKINSTKNSLVLDTNLINFKLSILKEQVNWLTLISEQKE